MLFNKKSVYFGCLFISTAFLFASCSHNTVGKEPGAPKKNDLPQSQVKLNVSPAFENINVAYQKYAVDPSSGQKIKVEKTGTMIDIPADAFVDEKGNPIKEKVEISFREFHDAADIIASGIPMHNPETGEYMETAGMFEIRGHCKGKEVFIAPDKKINVQLASYNEGNRFDFFKLDENGRWETKLENAEPEINLQRAEELKKIDAKLPQKPIELVKFGKTGKFVFDMKTDYTRFPELSIFKEVIWQYAGNPKDADNPENNPDVFNTNWSNIEVKRDENNYRLLLTQGKKKFEMRVQPVLKGADYEKAMADFNQKLKNYEKAKEEMAQIREMYENQAALQRSYSVSGFGIYNWDFWKGDSEKRLMVKADFDPEYDYAENLNTVRFFLVNNNRKAVVSYSMSDIKRFVFPANEKNMLVAVLPGNKVAVFSPEDFRNLNADRISNGTEVTFRMKTAKEEIKSIEDISKVLAMN